MAKKKTRSRSAVDAAREGETGVKKTPSGDSQQAELALCEGKRHYRLIFEHNLAGIYRTTPDGAILDCNEAMARMFGYASRAELMSARAPDLYCESADRTAFIDRLRKDGVLTNFELRMRRRDGSAIDILENAQLIPNENDTPSMIVGTILDITERKRAEEERDAILELSGDLICIAGIDGYFKYVNPAWERMLGYTTQELLARPFLDFIHPDDRAKNDAEVEKLNRGERTVGFENRYIAQDGSIHTVSWTATPAPGAGLLYCMGRDITERRRAEDALRESEATLKAAMDNSRVGIAIADAPDGRMRYVNDAALRFGGNSRPESFDDVAISEYGDTWPIFHLDGSAYQNDEVPLARAILRGETCGEEFVLRRADGEERIVWAEATPIKDAKGNVVRAVVVSLDVTDRVRAAEALRKSEERLSLALAAGQMGAWDWDIGSGRITWSEKHARLWGMQAEEFDGTYEAFEARVHPDDRAGVAGAVEQARVGHTAYVCEFRVIWPDGTQRWIRGSGDFEYDDGQPVRMLGVVQDITERKQTEEDLRRERDFAESLIETAQAIVLVLDPQGRIVRFNPYMERLSGYRLADVEGKDWFDTFLPERDRDRIRDLFSRAVGGVPTLGNVNPIVTKDGQERLIEWYDKTLKDAQGKVTGVVSVGQDITDRKQAEDALTESEERYRSLVENINLGITLINADYEIVMTNSFHGAAFGRPLCDFVGKKCYAEFEKREAVCPHCPGARAMAIGEPAEAESVGIRDDGSRFPVRIQAFPVIGPDGVTSGFIEVVEDITERKQAQAELEKLHEELVRSSRLAGMSEVATGVLHNVGNVLNSVNVSAGLVHEKIRGSRVPGLAKATALMSEHANDLGTFITQDERGKQLPGYLTKLAEYLAEEQTDVLGELRHLAENIDHIKNIVSMQQSLSGVSGVTGPVRIGNLLDDLLKMDASSLDHRGIKVVREYDELPVVTVDKHKLMQILVNLLKNAKEALTEDQGPDKRLTLRLRALDEDRVRVEVADNAMGISPENLKRIFEYGFTTKENGHGFGLHGSALAAKELGGSLTVCSDGQGQGATFTLELPLQMTEKSDVQVA
ncbi:MAG: PAS domain S-box protein [Planctomycetota bacterium]